MSFKKIIYKHDVTIVFTVSSIVNMLGSWGNFNYRFIIVLLNVVCGTLLEYLANKFVPKEQYGLWKSLIVLFLLIINCIWTILV